MANFECLFQRINLIKPRAASISLGLAVVLVSFLGWVWGSCLCLFAGYRVSRTLHDLYFEYFMTK